MTEAYLGKLHIGHSTNNHTASRPSSGGYCGIKTVEDGGDVEFAMIIAIAEAQMNGGETQAKRPRG